MLEKKWLAQLEDDEPHFFGKEKTKSPRRQRREAKQFSEALRKRRAEIEAEEALLKKNKEK